MADLAPRECLSVMGGPRATTLYGSLSQQLGDPESFASRVKKVLAVRQAYDIASSRQLLVPEVSHPGFLVMVHELPAGRGIQITILNFGNQTISEEIALEVFSPGSVVDMLNETLEDDLSEGGQLLTTLTHLKRSLCAWSAVADICNRYL